MSNSVLIFSDSRNNQLKIEKKNAIALELKLNVSIYGKEWNDIGDILYNFGTDKNIDLYCTISDEQYDFLKKLLSPGQPE